MLFISPPFGNYLTFFPNTIPIKGSYTTKPRAGLIPQIINTLQYSTYYKGWINKIGLRNPGIDYGISKYSKKSEQVLSIAIMKNEDIEYFYKKIPKDYNLEINISCPNVQSLCSHETTNIFLNEERKWCIIKLSPLDSYRKIDSLYKSGFRQFHCCNTYPLKLGGLSGPFLKPFVEDKIKYIKKKYNDVEIIAGEGIQDIDTLTRYKNLGADHFSISSLCFHPFKFTRFYFNYLREKQI